MIAEIGRDELVRMLRGAARQVRSRHEELSRLDSFGGDGDHGTTMLRAMEGVERVIDEAPAGTPGALLRDIGWALLGVDGGATGPLFGTFFLGMADATGERGLLDPPAFAAVLAGGLEALGRRTRAKPGDKTMMDALVPAVDAARAAAARGAGLPEVLRLAAEASEGGAASTREMAARFGRAKNLGAKSVGQPDPGATSVSLIFKGFFEGIDFNG